MYGTVLVHPSPETNKTLYIPVIIYHVVIFYAYVLLSFTQSVGCENLTVANSKWQLQFTYTTPTDTSYLMKNNA